MNAFKVNEHPLNLQAKKELESHQVPLEKYGPYSLQLAKWWVIDQPLPIPEQFRSQLADYLDQIQGRDPLESQRLLVDPEPEPGVELWEACEQVLERSKHPRLNLPSLLLENLYYNMERTDPELRLPGEQLT